MPLSRFPTPARVTPTPRAAVGCVVAIALGAPLTFATAQEVGPGGPGASEGSSWGLGIGVMSSQEPYKGMDRETKVLPMLSYENRYVRVFGPSIEGKLPPVKFGESQRLDFRIAIQRHMNGYDNDDAPIFSGMQERKQSFWAGVKVKWQTGVVDLTGEWSGDISSNSKGQRVKLGVEKTWRLGGAVMLTPFVAVNWQDKKYVDYYYGVRSEEAVAGRPAYAGRAATNPELGLRAMYRFDAHNSLLLAASVTSLDKGIKESPLVDRSTETKVMLGYSYRF